MPTKSPHLEEEILTEEREEVKKPGLYNVLLHNDDYTTMDFVVLVLKDFFHKNEAEATHIMLNVHKKGIGVAGIFTYEIAETKVYQVYNFAKENEQPLKCSMEPE